MTDNTTATTTWPYCARSGLLSRQLATNIRTWALTCMSEAELRSYSQRQLLKMYLSDHILPTLQKVRPWVTGEVSLGCDERDILRMPPAQLLNWMTAQVHRE